MDCEDEDAQLTCTDVNSQEVQMIIEYCRHHKFAKTPPTSSTPCPPKTPKFTSRTISIVHSSRNLTWMASASCSWLPTTLMCPRSLSCAVLPPPHSSRARTLK